MCSPDRAALVALALLAAACRAPTAPEPCERRVVILSPRDTARVVCDRDGRTVTPPAPPTAP